MTSSPRRAAPLLAVLVLAAGFALARAQAPAPSSAPSPSPAPSPPPSPVSAIRSKLAAGDLLSAENILEWHEEQHGQDGPWLAGLSWLARGALLVGDLPRAERYVIETRRACADRIAKGVDPAKDHDLETALGAAIEVETQRLERLHGRARAAAFARAELASLPQIPALRARIQKRIDLLTLVGQPAPELIVEDAVGAPPPTLASLRGKPVVLFVWAEWCGDCKGQSATLARVRARWGNRGVEFVALTRYYDPDSARAAEKARIDSVWTAVYAKVGPLPRVISGASMERYGGSSTPTFVFIDRKGIVRDYTPTRLTEPELDRRIAAIAR